MYGYLARNQARSWSYQLLLPQPLDPEDMHREQVLLSPKDFPSSIGLSLPNWVVDVDEYILFATTLKRV